MFVEGKDDVPVYEAWARTHGFGHSIQFVDAESWNNMHYFANAKVITSRRVKVRPFVIFDGDTDRRGKAQRIKSQMIERLHVPQSDILTLKMSELEGYLLDPRAVLAAFPEIRLLEQDLEEGFAPHRTKRNQNEVLDRLFQEYGIGRYDGSLGARIAEKMEAIPREIREFFDLIAREKA